LLLRADIHTLLDLQLIAIEPDTRKIVVSRLLARTQYQALVGVRLTEPVAEWQRPTQDGLDKIWRDFAETEATR